MFAFAQNHERHLLYTTPNINTNPSRSAPAEREGLCVYVCTKVIAIIRNEEMAGSMLKSVQKTKKNLDKCTDLYNFAAKLDVL